MKRVIFILLLGLLLLGTVTRFLWLDRFPVGISHDEAEVLLSAKTYWLFGTDISSTSFPKSIFTNLTSGGLSGLPSFLLTIGIYLLFKLKGSKIFYSLIPFIFSFFSYFGAKPVILLLLPLLLIV